MVADANLFTRDNLAGLTKERSEPEFISSCTYKFKVFKLSPILFFYIYWYFIYLYFIIILLLKSFANALLFIN